ncbi:plastocyanin/azurin family copper-binding protein [Halomontanus rarus]|uniref:plastocyanin/azurin family copper-binding protein n=1 Tax=Halomontanus rarus TaxID=3034020 RepID=UPI001A9A1128
MESRRYALRTIAVAALGGIAGCQGLAGQGSTNDEVDIRAGPRGHLEYDPEELTVSVGDTVVWGFPSENHNVCCVPADSDLADLPAGTEPFASYGDGEPLETVESGETYEHTFDVPGTYVYVCTPHEGAGMTGTVEVRDPAE